MVDHFVDALYHLGSVLGIDASNLIIAMYENLSYLDAR